MQPGISTFKAFAEVIVLASSTTSAPSVDDPKFEFIEFILEVEDYGGLCSRGGKYNDFSKCLKG